jgi:hypothetical protein
MEKYLRTIDTNGHDIELFSKEEKTKFFVAENVNGAVHPVEYATVEDAYSHFQTATGMNDESFITFLAENVKPVDE